MGWPYVERDIYEEEAAFAPQEAEEPEPAQANIGSIALVGVALLLLMAFMGRRK